MRRRMLKSKLHRATVTEAQLNYQGSISLDPALMALADIVEHEQVAVLDVDNGQRFETYAIAGGPGQVCLNGAAARLVQLGDRIIVVTYADYDEAEVAAHSARVVLLDEANRPVPAVALGPVTPEGGRALGPYSALSAPTPGPAGPGY